ncbi:MAG: hypothetical protein ABSE19_04665 [Candidatus Acidiferrum sp.]|jgi:hypothetical protein
MKRILYLAAATIAICLITPAAYAQRSDLDLRFHVPFQFSIGNNTFAAGDYVVTRPTPLKLIFRNPDNHTSAIVSVLPASSGKDGNGHTRVVFHCYGSEYFLAFVSEGSLESTFAINISKEEMKLAEESPRKPVTIVSVVPSSSTLQAALSSQK